MNGNTTEQEQTALERAEFIFNLPSWLLRPLGQTVDHPPDLQVALGRACEYKNRWYGPLVSLLIHFRFIADEERSVLVQTERIYKELCFLVGLPLEKWPKGIPHTSTLYSALTIANIRNVMIWRAAKVLRLKMEYEKVTGSGSQSRHAHCRLAMLIDDAEREFSETFVLFVKYGGTETRRWIFEEAAKVPQDCHVAVT